MRLLAVVEYDGTDFAGFQLQARGRTVQLELESALATCTGEAVRVIGSGRTDAGVHARGQAAHFDTAATIAAHPDQLLRALNAHLPTDVKVRALRRVPETLHARHSALSRRYCYRVLSGRIPSPLHRRYAHHVRAALSCQAMSDAAQLLEGTHDFIAFASEEGPGSTVRRIDRARVWPVGAAAGVGRSDRPVSPGEPIWHTYGDSAQLIEIEVEASGFLRHMMRRIAGTLLRVGDGRLRPEDVATILASRDKSLAGPTAPARGLCLESIAYPDQEMQQPE
ncbi:MAG TPA: tRNA pseudouridine(38-40) synthase TruA [Chloroflexota bacterium]|nr:tRNA pseudouridine(38-40) synthase TruA [Chloroflexota bacterium]